MRSTRSVSLPLAGDGTLRRLAKRNLGALTGLALLAVAAAIAASLATWAADDPSLSHATGLPARNFLGLPGALVADIFMPPLGVLIGGVDFKDLKYVLTTEMKDGVEVAGAAIAWGKTVNVAIEFAIVVLCAFTVVKVMNKLISIRISDLRSAKNA